MALRRRGAAKPPREGARGRDKGRDDRELGAFEVQLGLGNLLRHLIIGPGQLVDRVRHHLVRGASYRYGRDVEEHAARVVVADWQLRTVRWGRV